MFPGTLVLLEEWILKHVPEPDLFAPESATKRRCRGGGQWGLQDDLEMAESFLI